VRWQPESDKLGVVAGVCYFDGGQRRPAGFNLSIRNDKGACGLARNAGASGGDPDTSPSDANADASCARTARSARGAPGHIARAFAAA